MFRLRGVNTCLRRLFHVGTVARDQLLTQLQVCTAEEQVFDLVGKNKAKLTATHVGSAVSILWEFQKDRPERFRTLEIVKAHPQFTTLRILAESQVPLIDDTLLVDLLYSLIRLDVEPHDSLIQQLMVEAWQRLESLPFGSLSKFSICLNYQHLHHSSLMGHITNIVDQRLSSIDDVRILSSLMISISSCVSQRLRDALLARVECIMDTLETPDSNTARRVVLFMRKVKFVSRHLLERCNQILVESMPSTDAQAIYLILGLYQNLQFFRCDFMLASKQRLIELMDSDTDPDSFSKLFTALAPLASSEIKERLEETAFLLADDVNAHRAVVMLETLEESQSRNNGILNKLASVIQKNLDIYTPVDVVRISRALSALPHNNPELLTKLRTMLLNFLEHSVAVSEVIMLIRSLSMLPRPWFDKTVASSVEAVAPQASLNELKTLTFSISRWAQTEHFYHHRPPREYVHLLQLVNCSYHNRLQTIDRLDLLLDELKHISREGLEEVLINEAIGKLQRMMDQINWVNVPDLAHILTTLNYLCPPLMDRIASVVIKDTDKLHYSAIYTTLIAFSTLNYIPAQAEELYDVCIQNIIPQISSFEPYLLVFQAYYLALANYFPEKLVREIFTVSFLEKLDSQLEAMPHALNMLVRQNLMELNRAVCLECPEFHVPWFHDSFCQQYHKKGKASSSSVLPKVHRMLGEVLGGMNYVRASVFTPYFYTIDVECILDKHLQPLPFSTPDVTDTEQVGLLQSVKEDLPPGAQRVAVDFHPPSDFCSNVHHMKGEILMKKRHLEILGYHVVQIPHFEWNSMELSTQDAWKNYLKKKIFTDLSS